MPLHYFNIQSPPHNPITVKKPALGPPVSHVLIFLFDNEQAVKEDSVWAQEGRVKMKSVGEDERRSGVKKKSRIQDERGAEEREGIEENGEV